MDISKEKRGSVTILRPTGQLDLFSAKELRNEVQELVRQGITKLIVDFESISYLDSSGVGALLHIYSTAKSGAFALRFANVGGPVAHVIELTKLTDYFPIAETVETAQQELDSC